jgi:hypothetical protein
MTEQWGKKLIKNGMKEFQFQTLLLLLLLLLLKK